MARNRKQIAAERRAAFVRHFPRPKENRRPIAAAAAMRAA